MSELQHLKSQWDRREGLLAAHHPVPLTELFHPDEEIEAKLVDAKRRAVDREPELLKVWNEGQVKARL